MGSFLVTTKSLSFINNYNSKKYRTVIVVIKIYSDKFPSIIFHSLLSASFSFICALAHFVTLSLQYTIKKELLVHK